MRESKLVRQLRELKIFNSYEFYWEMDGKHHAPYIDQYVRGGRDVYPSTWTVIQHGVNLDPKGHFRDQGAKSFSYYNRETSKEAFQKALAWATERFGVKEWVRDPFGGFGPAEFVSGRLKRLGLRK